MALAAARAAGAAPLPVSLLGDNPLAALEPHGDLARFGVTTVKVEGQPFDEALRVEVRESAPAVWDAQLRAKCTAPVAKGDVLHIEYWVRAVSTASEIAEVSFLNAVQLDRKPWTHVFDESPKFGIPDGWTALQRVVVSKQSFKAGEYVFNIQFGGLDPQTFEIGGLHFLNYGPAYDASGLPVSKRRPYAGSEPDAPWRAAALERIERIRKTDLSVRVLGAGGAPVKDAKVEIEMTRHAFGWGAAMYAWLFASDTPDAARYREEFLRNFNLLVPENGLKWKAWEQPKSRDATMRMLGWARENGCEVRGHTLVWPSFGRNPESVARLRTDPESLRAAIRGHIADIVPATRGMIRAWDVINEPTTNHEFMDILGADVVGEWFRQAHELDPQAQLFLNENQVLAGTKLKSFELWADCIVASGGELGGLGIQGHLGYGTCAPERMLEIFTRLHDRFRVPLSITELDVNVKDPADQAQYLRDVLIAAFSHPAVDSVTFWGFWDGRHWLNNSPLYAKDWSEKPACKVFRQLVHDDWRTRATLATGADGTVSLRAFKGRYRVAITLPDGTVRTHSINLTEPTTLDVD